MALHEPTSESTTPPSLENLGLVPETLLNSVERKESTEKGPEVDEVDIADIVTLRREIEVVYEGKTEQPVMPEIPQEVLDKWTNVGEKQTKVRLRAVQEKDIDILAELDALSFWNVYKDYGKSYQEMVDEMRGKLRARFERLQGQWWDMVEDTETGRPLAFILSCPTSKTPDDFTCWEEMTDNGTLESTYDPAGKNIYIVSLTMVPHTLSGEVQNMLYGATIGKIIEGNYERAFFESRLPRLREWMMERCANVGLIFEDLTPQQQQGFANEYAKATKIVKGKEVPYDPLLHTYKTVGCRLGNIVPNAYKDKPSMDFGAVCIFENPLPKSLRRTPIRQVAGKLCQTAAKSHKLMKKLF